MNALPTALAARVADLLAERAEAWGAERVLPVATLESGMRLGLSAARWIAVTDAGEVIVGEGERLYRFYEVVEQTRDSFDEALDQAARELALPADDLHLSFPVVEIIRAILARESTYLIRKALLFLRTTELRDARADIAALERRNLPSPLKDLARRLLVPG